MAALVVMHWNADKPHRCPSCHAVTDPDRVAKWRIVTCCRCRARFTRLARLAAVLPQAGVVCPEHKEP
jgi:ribosomal protein L37AE/L43A